MQQHQQQRHLANRNEMRVPLSTAATNVAVLLIPTNVLCAATQFSPALKKKTFKPQNSKQSSAFVIAPQVDTATTEALRYTARTEQRRTYLPYTFPAVAGTHLLTPIGWRVE